MNTFKALYKQSGGKMRPRWKQSWNCQADLRVTEEVEIVGNVEQDQIVELWWNIGICESRSWHKSSWMEPESEVTQFSLKGGVIPTTVVPGWRASYSLWSGSDISLSQNW